MVNERVRKVFTATRALGIPDQEVKPVLKNLLKLYDKKWELIEAEDYRALIDAYFESKEDKGVEEKENVVVPGQSSRLSKQLRLQELEDQASSTKGNASQILSPDESEKPMISLQQGVKVLQKKDSSSSGCSNSFNKVEQQLVTSERKRLFHIISDITKGTENVKISLVDEIGNQDLPKFIYMRNNVIYQKAYVHVSMARVADEDCCSGCSGDCLSVPIPCACAHETGGEFAYTPEGQLREEFLRACMSMKMEPQEHHFVYLWKSSSTERYCMQTADWGSEKVLRDEDALCLDATFCGNVARFINHRCFDANLIDIPVEVETPDRHYYHLALFTTRDVRASEELTWIRYLPS
ncbi:hypothetical protein PTKIN_Ptkin01aG0355200 [Pterospermum kingtungense]